MHTFKSNINENKIYIYNVLGNIIIGIFDGN